MANVAVIYNIAPVFTVIIGAVAFKEKVTCFQYVSIVMSFAGVALITIGAQ